MARLGRGRRQTPKILRAPAAPTIVGTSQTYTPQQADIGHRVVCVVTATNSYGSAITASNQLGPITGVAPVATITPVVTGSRSVPGYVLSCDTGTWLYTPSSYGYQWQRDNSGAGTFSDIAASTATSYTLVTADKGCYVRCVVTATNTTGATAANSNQIGLIQGLEMDAASAALALDLLAAAQAKTRRQFQARPDHSL